MIYNSDPNGAPNLAEAKRIAAIESNKSSGGFSKNAYQIQAFKIKNQFRWNIFSIALIVYKIDESYFEK